MYDSELILIDTRTNKKYRWFIKDEEILMDVRTWLGNHMGAADEALDMTYPLV